jgi:hypothetical protein
VTAAAAAAAAAAIAGWRPWLTRNSGLHCGVASLISSAGLASSVS